MARPLRIEYPGALYHLASRGNAQFERPRPGRAYRGRCRWASRRSCARWRLRLKSKALAKEIPQARRRDARPSLKQACRVDPADRGARDRLIATLRLKNGYTQANIAAQVGLRHATVSRIVNRRIDSRYKT